MTAVVALRDGEPLDEAALRRWVHDRLAGYKVPKRVLAAPRPMRADNGKADYQAARAFAAEALGITLS